MPTSALPRRVPPGRYGERRGPPTAYYVSAVVAATVLAVFAVVFFGLQAEEHTAAAGVVSWRTLANRRVEVLVEVRKPKPDTARCGVQVLDAQHGILGQAELTVGPGATDSRVDATVPTTGAPAAVQVSGCSLVHRPAG